MIDDHGYPVPTDHARDRAPGSEHRDAPLAPWPPPDLARIQGELWEMIRLGALGSLILVLPLLWTVATEQEFWSLGPFGESAWVPLATTAVGLFLVFATIRALFRVLGRAANAADRGYGRLTLLEVVADVDRDMGFLAQGARLYGELEVGARNRLIRYRILSAVAYLGAALWVPLGFAGAVLVAARGVPFASTTMIWLVTMVPSALLLVVGSVPRILEERAVEAALGRWTRTAEPTASPDEEVREWLARLEPSAAALGLEPGRKGQGRILRMTSAVSIVALVFVAVPVISVAFATTLGPQVAKLAVPDFATVQEDAAAIAPLRRYALEPDPAVSPAQAGEALNALVHVGTDGASAGLLLPSPRALAEPWFPADPEGVGPIVPAVWVLEVLERAPEGLGSAERRYLERLASHPGQAEMGVLARAERADVVGTRWRLPFPDTLTLLTLPIPSYGSVREAGYARVGLAAWEVSRGRVREAEKSLREVISAGFLLVDEGPVLADALAGMQLVETGADALETLYRATGRVPDAEGLAWARAAASGGAALGRAGRSEGDVETLVQGMSAVVIQPGAPKGLRWDVLGAFQTLSPCINVHKIVFGPGADYDAWLERARAGLVRFPSEEELFGLARGGWLGAGLGATSGGGLGRLLMASLGGAGRSGSCTTLIAGSD